MAVMSKGQFPDPSNFITEKKAFRMYIVLAIKATASVCKNQQKQYEAWMQMWKWNNVQS